MWKIPAPGETLARVRLFFDLAASVAMIVAAAVLIRVGMDSRTNASVRTRAEPPVPSAPVSLQGATLKGNANAAVALLMFSDFQCPFCARFAREVLPKIEERYVSTGQVVLAFRHFPLAIHGLARGAAESAECARQQGRFWDMHDWLFKDPSHLTDAQINERIAELRLNKGAFDMCRSSEGADRVAADTAMGKNLGVSGTPGFLAGVRQSDGRIKFTNRLSGARPYIDFQHLLDGLIAKHGS